MEILFFLKHVFSQRIQMNFHIKKGIWALKTGHVISFSKQSREKPGCPQDWAQVEMVSYAQVQPKAWISGTLWTSQHSFSFKETDQSLNWGYRDVTIATEMWLHHFKVSEVLFEGVELGSTLVNNSFHERNIFGLMINDGIFWLNVTEQCCRHWVH